MEGGMNCRPCMVIATRSSVSTTSVTPGATVERTKPRQTAGTHARTAGALPRGEYVMDGAVLRRRAQRTENLLAKARLQGRGERCCVQAAAERHGVLEGMQEQVACGTGLEMAAHLLADSARQLVVEISRKPAEDFDAGGFGTGVLVTHGRPLSALSG